MSIQSNAERHLAEWIAQWEGILQGNKTAFSRSPLAGEVGKAHAATLGTTTTHGIGKSTKRDKRKAAAGTAAVAALEGDTSGDVGPEEPLSEYEQQRLTRIA